MIFSVKTFYRRQIKKETVTLDEEVLFFQDNKQWISWTDRAMFNPDGSVSVYQSVGTDITELKKIQFLQQLENDFLNNLIDANPNVIIVKDADGNILKCNISASERYGRTPEEMKGMNDYVLNAGLVEDDIIKTSDKLVLEKNETMVFPDQEFVDQLSGKKRFYQSIKIPISTEDPNIKNILVVAVDITERKLFALALEKSNNELKALTDALKKSNNELQNFAYVASHDLQEPLRMITGYMQLFEKRYGDKFDQDAKEYMYFAIDGAKRMQQLITDLLNYSRIQTRPKPFKEINMNKLIGDVLKNLDSRIKESNVNVQFDDLPEIVGDKSQITQLFQNLIDNAIKFKSEVNPFVKIGFADQGNHYLVSIEDNGIGIEEKDMIKVFDIFNRLHSHSQYPGTGIGLSICQKIVQRHGGKIWIDKSFTDGCKFLFTIKKLSIMKIAS